MDDSRVLLKVDRAKERRRDTTRHGCDANRPGGRSRRTEKTYRISCKTGAGK